MEDDKAGSEHTLPSASSKTSLSDSKEMKPCEKCESNTNDSTCIRCCAKLLLQLPAKPDDGKDTANSGLKHLPSSPVSSKETSPVSTQKQSDSDMPSGSESAK